MVRWSIAGGSAGIAQARTSWVGCGKGGKTISHSGGALPRYGLFGGSLSDASRGQRPLETHADQVELFPVDHPNDPCFQLPGSFGCFRWKGKGRHRNLEHGPHGKRQGAPRGHQDAPSAHVEARGEVQGLFAIRTDTTKKYRQSERKAVPLSLFPVMWLTLQGLGLGSTLTPSITHLTGHNNPIG